MTDTMLFGILKMPFEMAMKDEISRIQFYGRVQELVGRFEAQQQAEPVLQEIEQYRMQMAGISTAAIGYWKEGDGIHPDYDTLALRDVAKLYAKYDELYKAQPEQQAEPVAYDKTAMNCQCEACKNGNIHDSDCSVHNGDALPVGPCDCSLATPPQQQAEPVGQLQECLYGRGQVLWFEKPADLSMLYTAPPQRKELSASEILNMMPSTIPAEYDGPLMEFARAVEAKLKERNK